MKTQYDMIVIGAGSGGIAAARRASEYGARCAVIENKKLGGTCVNVGCVPKKVMWTTSRIAEMLEDAPDYGFRIENRGFEWATIKRARDEYIARLNSIYAGNLDKANVDTVFGTARFDSANSIEVNGTTYHAPHILIAAGGQPTVPDVPGSELAITSDGFFEMEDLPRKVVINGAGYIATEFAGMLNGLGSEVVMVLRKDQLLRGFDSSMTSVVTSQMKRSGIKILTNTAISSLRQEASGLAVELNDGTSIVDVDKFIFAIGRKPCTQGLGLENTDVRLNSRGYIETDQYQNSAQQGVYAVGDVTGRVALTPVAIAAGRKLSDRLFGGVTNAHLDYDNIPSVIFSHPPIGTVGLSEQAARAQYGDDVRIYISEFQNMYYQVTRRSSPTLMKLITTGSDEKIIGCHVVGDFADEIIQGFSVAVKMGARKQDFDNTVAIHPTASEELVTLR
ncbi:MAG: glutathione-disulfide reductase [Acidiferrobacterales bacterium]|nr:glutathione-disulfide reductase [Acidiferrobacterales bacterium]